MVLFTIPTMELFGSRLQILKFINQLTWVLSFQQFTSIGENDPYFLQVIYPAELPIQASKNGQFLSIVGAFEGAYLIGNPDIVYRYFSTDFGVTWQGEVIGRGSGSNPEYGQISNRDYAPYFTNFAQCNSVVDDNGVTHIVFNGYGQGILPGSTDTTEVFPILYWNSNYREWVAVTSIELESPDDGFGHSIADYYPFPAIGNAYPSVMVSSDGWRVIVVWTGPEFTGSGNTPYNIYPGDGGPNSAAVYYTDLYVAFSYNGGEEITGGNPAVPQSNKLVIEKMKIPDHQSMKVYSNEKYNSSAINPGEELFNTDYDYMCTNSIGPMIALVDLDGDGVLDPIMTGMARQNIGQRTVRFAYTAFGYPPVSFSAFDTTNATSGSNTYGWGNLQVCVGGAWDGNALMFAHSNGDSYWSLIDLTNLTPLTPFSTVSIPGNFPSFVYLNDGTILMNNTNFVFYRSTDYGVTFDSLFFIGDGDPNFTYNSSNRPSELPIMKSDDGMFIATVGGFDDVFNSGNPDGLYWYGSSDGGVTWSGLAAGKGSGNNPQYGQVINRDYAPYFTNFAQVNYNVSNDGVTHLVCNGYGEGVLPGATDTTNVFPILYWNSNHQNWIAITDPSTEGPTDGFGNYVTGPLERLYAGNGIGQAYPNVATSADGQIVFVVWQGFEYTGEIGNSEWNVYPGDGSAQSSSIYFTDLYYAYSTDFGETWSTPNILKGDADVMEQYPYLARRIEFQGNELMVHYIYQEDAIPGIAVTASQWGQNSYSNDTRWLYDYWSNNPPSVEDDITLSEFTLEQNYPNPFNPNTMISISVTSEQ